MLGLEPNAGHLSIPLNGFCYRWWRWGWSSNPHYFQFHWMDSISTFTIPHPPLRLPPFQFHWMDSTVEPPLKEALLNMITFNSVEWIPGCLLSGLRAPMGAWLSIPLNGFVWTWQLWLWTLRAPRLSIPLNGFLGTSWQPCSRSTPGTFQFHWMDSGHVKHTVLGRQASHFQFHWVDSTVSPNWSSPRSSVSFQFHWMDSLCYRGLPYYRVLSIPLNGFLTLNHLG